MKPSAILIGASAGGVAALQQIFLKLRDGFQTPVIVAQHIARESAVDLNLVFGRHFKGPIFEARDKTELAKGGIYFAPAGYHLLLERDLSLSVSQDEPVQFSRPSIDVLFDSAVHSLGAAVCGVLLTGANSDGALGLKNIDGAGGITIVQDPLTADSPTMPQSAITLFRPRFVLPLLQIAECLNRLDEGIYG